MRRLKGALRGFFIGLIGGAVLGALGGTLDRGSMFILVPSGPPFWGLFGAFAGSIVGALGGVIFPLGPKDPSSGAAEAAGCETKSEEER
jgi:hypothetical protein